MKLTQILIILLSLAYGHSACAMNKPRIGKRWRIAESILKKVLLAEHDNACQKFTVKLTENYKARLNTLYEEVLEQNQINQKATPAIELRTFWGMIMDQIISLKQARLTEIHRFSENRLNFQDISPIVNVFKKEKGFVFEPHLDTTDLETLLRFHAMLSALTYSLRELDEWIHAKAEIEYDI